MSTSPWSVSRRWCVLLAFALAVSHGPRVSTQQLGPWTGVAANEARLWPGWPTNPWAGITRDGMSADGRFVVFASSQLGAGGDPDPNYSPEIFVRDRVTGAVESVAIDDNGWSRAASEAVISDDGRYVAWGQSFAMPHDIFVYDRTLATAVRVNVSASGEPMPIAYGISMSGDGRFIAFIGSETFSNPPYSAWLRDRDVDGDGIFDEPGDSATTLIGPPPDPNFWIWDATETAISPDGRYTAYVASTYDPMWGSIGKRVYVHDRILGTTVRADDPGPAAGWLSMPEARDLHFSNAGQLVYTHDDDLLGDEEGWAERGVFVFDIASSTISKIALTHAGAPVLYDLQGPALSGDGRYVVFVGREDDPTAAGQPIYNVFAVDRQTQLSYAISTNPDGQRNNLARNVAINGDGSAIAFTATTDVLAQPTVGLGLFVATGFSMQGGQTSVPAAGGTYTIALTAPDHTSWEVAFDDNAFSNVSPTSGTGSATIEVTLIPNTSPESKVSSVYVGSARASFHQVALDTTPPVITPIITGGTESIYGWYNSDITVEWTVDDPQSALQNVECPTRTFTTDTYGDYASCSASSEGGHSQDYVPVRRDSTPPTTHFAGVVDGATYPVGAQVPFQWACDDALSGTVDCVPSQYGPYLDTSTPGLHTLTLHASDAAGNVTDTTLTYRVQMTTFIEAPAASGVFGGTTVLSARLLGNNTPLAGRTITFSIDQSAVGTAMTNAAGVAALDVNLSGRNAGSYTTRADYAGEESAPAAGVDSSLVIAKAATSVTWNAPAAIVYGTALSAAQLNATASVAGSFAYSPAAGSILNAGTQALSVTFTPADAVNYHPASGAQSVTVTAVPLTVRTDNTAKVYGQALPAFTISGTGFVNGDTVASLTGTPAFSTPATATSVPGNYTVTPSGVSSANYTISFAAGMLTITKANTSVTFTTSPSPSNHNQTVQLRAVVAAVAPGAGTPTGTVQFRENGTLLGTATVVNGVATLNRSFRRGSHPLTATYSGSTTFNGSSASRTHQTQ